MRPIPIMEVHLRLEVEMKEVGLGKAEDIFRIFPLGDSNRDDGIKTRDRQLKYSPKEVITITRF